MDVAKLDKCVDQLSGTRDLTKAARLLRKIGKIIGLPLATCVDDYSEFRLPLIEDGRTLPTLFGWDQEFINDWEDKRLHLISPMGFVCRLSTKPFSWLADSAQMMQPLADDNRQKHWHLTAERGIYGGIIIPIHMPMGRVGSIGWVAMGEQPDLDLDAILDEVGSTLRMAAITFMDILYDTRPDRDLKKANITLTEREVECLSWIALGKTDAEIATIIDRSIPTVRFHLENAMKKMDVSNRTQAAALASQLGILGSLLR